jgi:hypothetical protein
MNRLSVLMPLQQSVQIIMDRKLVVQVIAMEKLLLLVQEEHYLIASNGVPMQALKQLL